MGLASLSASQVSSMCRELDACVENLQSRLFGNAGFPYVFLDATYISCRDSGRVSKAALVTAIGVFHRIEFELFTKQKFRVSRRKFFGFHGEGHAGP
jgi:hypothetical protein